MILLTCSLQAKPCGAFDTPLTSSCYKVIQSYEDSLTYGMSKNQTRLVGFEPTNNGVKVRCLNHLAIAQKLNPYTNYR